MECVQFWSNLVCGSEGLDDTTVPKSCHVGTPPGNVKGKLSEGCEAYSMTELIPKIGRDREMLLEI